MINVRKLLVVLAAASLFSPASTRASAHPVLTKTEAHDATVVRMHMLLHEWPNVIVSYSVVPAHECKRHSAVVVSCSYRLTNDPQGFTEPVVCNGRTRVRYGHRVGSNIDVTVALGACESQSGSPWHIL